MAWTFANFFLSGDLQNFHFLFFTLFDLKQGLDVYPELTWNSPCSWPWRCHHPASIFSMLGLLVMCHQDKLGRKFLLYIRNSDVVGSCRNSQLPCRGQGTIMVLPWRRESAEGLLEELWACFCLCLPSYLPSKEKGLETCCPLVS